MKKFMKKTEGFTLVELIVVIAILGILAGVGTVGYSGYIKKANEAADNQLLATVNHAFAVACMENGKDASSLRTASMPFTSTKTIDMTNVDPYAEDFAKYYAGNEDSAFKVASRLLFRNGVFVLDLGESKTVTIGDKTYNVSQQSIDNFKKATAFSENVPELQGQVDTLSTAFGGFAEMIDSLAPGSLGLAFGDGYVDFLEKMGADTATEMGNATVLYVAQQSSSMTAQSAMDSLCRAALYMQTNAGSNPGLLDVLEASGADGDPLSTAAMMYGAVTAYANGQNDAALKAQAAGVNDGTTLLQLFQSAASNEGFLNYCGSFDYDQNGFIGSHPTEQFVTDMNGYLGALDAMSTVSDGIKDNLDTNDAWSNDQIDKLLEEILKEQ